MSESAQVTELLQRGIAAARAGRKQEARAALLQVTDLDERNEQAWLWLSGAVDTPEDRRVCLENVLAVNPRNPHARAGLRILEQQAPAAGQQPPVAAAGERSCPLCTASVSSTDEVCPKCNQVLTVACPGCGRPVAVEETACPACEQPLGNFRDGARYHLSLAQAYLEAEQVALVEKAMVRAELEAYGDARVLEGLPALYVAMGRTDEAIAAYKRAIQNTPGNGALYVRLAAIYRDLDMPAEVRELCHEAMERSGDDPATLYEMARFETKEEGATPKALEFLQRVIELDPEHAQAHLLLGDVCFKQHDRAQAIRHYERVCALSGPDSQIGRRARRRLKHASKQPKRGKGTRRRRG